MFRALRLTGLGLGALVLWAACTFSGVSPQSSQPPLSFTVQNFTDQGMVFQVVVNEDLSSVQVYRVNGGGNQLITIPFCPTTVRFTGIRYDDQTTSPDVNFYAGAVTSVSQGVLPGQPLSSQPTSQAYAFPTFVCPAAFQLNAYPGQLVVALATSQTVGGAPATPTQAFQFITITPTVTFR